MDIVLQCNEQRHLNGSKQSSDDHRSLIVPYSFICPAFANWIADQGSTGLQDTNRQHVCNQTDTSEDSLGRNHDSVQITSDQSKNVECPPAPDPHGCWVKTGRELVFVAFCRFITKQAHIILNYKVTALVDKDIVDSKSCHKMQVCRNANPVKPPIKNVVEK